MKHLKHLCHSNKKSYLSCWQNQTMKKRILQLKEPEGSICTLKSTVTGRHLWPQHNFSEIIRHKHSPLGVLKLSFHTEIFVNTEETLSDAQFTLISTVIIWVPSRSFHSHSLLCLPTFPAGSCLFQLKNKRQKPQIYINYSDLTDRTGHWIENQCLKYLKRSFVFKQSETDKEKVHTLVCVDACAQNF